MSTVDCRAEKLTATSDGKLIRTLPTSCGKAATPTYTGTKVVMQKGEDIPAPTGCAQTEPFAWSRTTPPTATT
jgi:hypothetical protein